MFQYTTGSTTERTALVYVIVVDTVNLGIVTQVEQTRGQAFEAGFAPVPRLFSSARVARRARPESNGHRRRKPGNTSPSREHRVLRGGQGRKRGRRDRDLKIRRSSSERAAELVRAEVWYGVPMVGIHVCEYFSTAGCNIFSSTLFRYNKALPFLRILSTRQKTKSCTDS